MLFFNIPIRVIGSVPRKIKLADEDAFKRISKVKFEDSIENVIQITAMIGSTPEFTGKQPDDCTVDTIRAEDPVNLHGTLSQPHSEPALYPRTANNRNYSDVDEEYFAISSERNITDTTTNNAPDMPELEDSDSEELTMDDFRNRRRSDLENIGIDEVDDDVNLTSGSKGSSEVDGGQKQQKQQECVEGAAKQPDCEPSDSKEYKDFTIIDSVSSTTTNTDEPKSKSDDTLKTSESDKTNVPETVTTGTVAIDMKEEGQEPPTDKDTKEGSETTTTTAATAIDSGTGNDSTSGEVSTTATTSSLTSTAITVTSTATSSTSLESSSVVNTTTDAGTSSTTSVSEASSAANASTSSTPVPEARSSTNDTPTTVSQTNSGANVNAASDNSSTSNIVAALSTASTGNNSNNANTVNNNDTDTATTTTVPTTTGVTVAEVNNGVVVVTEEKINTENVDGSVGDKAKEDEEDEEKMLENSKAWMQEKLLGLIGAIIPSNERSVSAFIVCFWFAIYLFAYMSYSLERSCIF